MSALLKEVAAILVAHGDEAYSLVVSGPDGSGALLLGVSILPTRRPLDSLSLRHELEYLRDVASLRAIADRYDIPPEKLEALLPQGDR